MKKRLIYIFVILLIGLFVISACEQYVGRRIDKKDSSNYNQNSILEERVNDNSKPESYLIDIKPDNYVSDFNENDEIHFYARPSNITPYIDGNLDEYEISDADYQNIEGSNDGLYDIYTKIVSVNNKLQLYFGMRIYHEDIGAISPFIYLYFDEGDDGSFGSGTRDMELNINQEDIKEVDHASDSIYCKHFFGFVEGCPTHSCNPRNQGNCWECSQDMRVYGSDLWSGSYCEHTETGEVVDSIRSRKTDLMDGLWDSRAFGEGWYAEAYGNHGAYDRINFMAYYNEANGSLDVEFLIPLIGLDNFSNGSFDDESDINVIHNNILGFGIIASNRPFLTELPADLDRFDARTYTPLEINICYDSDEGNNKFNQGIVSYFNNVTYVRRGDYCINNNRLVEYYCSNNGLGISRNYNCLNGCSNGVCINNRLNRKEIN